MKIMAKAIVYLLLFFIILSTISSVLGIRVNTSASIPLGFYYTSDKLAEKGDYVIFCPPHIPVFEMAKERGYILAGFCTGGYGYVMKKIVAVGGDLVSSTERGIMVNGEVLPLTKSLEFDKQERLLPQYKISSTLSSDQFFLMSDVSKNSFDSRYFGAINNLQIEGVITPLLTW